MKVLLLDNYDSFTYNLYQFLLVLGADVTVARNDETTVAEIEAGFFRDFRPTSLIKRFTSAEEVANLAVYLCGAGASATTGAAMRADGGVVNQIM